MDEQERKYLVSFIRSAERAKRRWPMSAVAALAALLLALFVMIGGYWRMANRPIASDKASRTSTS
jgi:hypothetical protein